MAAYTRNDTVISSAGNTATEDFATKSQVLEAYPKADKYTHRYKFFFKNAYGELTIGSCKAGRCYGLNQAQRELFEGALGTHYREVLARAEHLVGRSVCEKLLIRGGFDSIKSSQSLLEKILSSATTDAVGEFCDILMAIYETAPDRDELFQGYEYSLKDTIIVYHQRKADEARRATPRTSFRDLL